MSSKAMSLKGRIKNYAKICVEENGILNVR